MNFAGKNLNRFLDSSELTAREKRLLAENKRLKKRNKRLSSAMVFLVTHVEKRLPFFNAAAKAQETPPLSSPEAPKAAPTPRPPKRKKKIIGEAWQPEKLEAHIKKADEKRPRRKDPLSMHQIFADKKKEKTETGEETSPVVPFPSNDIEPAVIENAPQEQEPIEIYEEDLPEETEVIVLSAEPADEDGITPELAPEEMNILAAPTKEKHQDVFHPQPSEILTEREEKQTSAQEASMAYMAVSAVSKPVPDQGVEILSDDDADLPREEDTISHEIAQQSEVMRAAMLRRVNRLRW